MNGRARPYYLLVPLMCWQLYKYLDGKEKLSVMVHQKDKQKNVQTL